MKREAVLVRPRHRPWRSRSRHPPAPSPPVPSASSSGSMSPSSTSRSSSRSSTVAMSRSSSSSTRPASRPAGFRGRSRWRPRASSRRTRTSSALGSVKLGGKIQRQYQYTLNGIQLRVPSRRLGALAKLPGVKAVHAVTQHYMDNAKSVPFIGAPPAWPDYGATGNGQTIAVIDAGIDYTHANFGGPGTVEAYEANDSSVIEDGTFPTAKVIDGWDFAGDDYDAGADDGSESRSPTPIRSTALGHGSHVAGTAAGDGVLVGPHRRSVVPTTSRPTRNTSRSARRRAAGEPRRLKVFGCEGSTTLASTPSTGSPTTTPPCRRIDVVNMSLGAPFGRAETPTPSRPTPSSQRRDRRLPAGNAGPNAYITGIAGRGHDGDLGRRGTPSRSTRVRRGPRDGPDINAINQNALPEPPGQRHAAGHLSDPGTPSTRSPVRVTSTWAATPPTTAPCRRTRSPSSSVASARSSTRARPPRRPARSASSSSTAMTSRPGELPPSSATRRALRHPDGRHRPARQGRPHRPPTGRQPPWPAGPGIPNDPPTGQLGLHLRRPEARRQRPEARRQRPRREHHLDRRWPGFQGQRRSPAPRWLRHTSPVSRRSCASATRASGRSRSSRCIVGTAVQAKVSPFNARLAGSGMVQPRRAGSTRRVRPGNGIGRPTSRSATTRSGSAATASRSRSRSTTRVRRRSSTSSTVGSSACPARAVACES